MQLIAKERKNIDFGENVVFRGYTIFDNENGKFVGAIDKFLDEENEDITKLVVNAPQMKHVLQEIMKVYDEKGQLLSFDVNLVREILNKV